MIPSDSVPASEEALTTLDPQLITVVTRDITRSSQEARLKAGLVQGKLYPRSMVCKPCVPIVDLKCRHHSCPSSRTSSRGTVTLIDSGQRPEPEGGKTYIPAKVLSAKKMSVSTLQPGAGKASTCFTRRAL